MGVGSAVLTGQDAMKEDEDDEEEEVNLQLCVLFAPISAYRLQTSTYLTLIFC